VAAVRAPPFRSLPLLLAAALGAGCSCGASHAVTDAGRDGGRDAGRDGGRDAGRDGGRDAGDAGPLVPFPEGWEPVPWLPVWCDAWRPRGEAASAIEALRFEAPCAPPAAGCERLAVDWERSEVYPGYLAAGPGRQTSGGAPVITFERPRPERSPRGGEYEDSAVYTLEGTPVAVWRTSVAQPPERRLCSVEAVGWGGGELALAFWPYHQFYDTTHDDQYYFVVLLADALDRLQHSDRVLDTLYVSELLSEGNVPDELVYDGHNLVVHGPLGAVYLGSMGGRPFGEIATARTGDYQNVDGLLFEDAFYWSAEARGRVRRRLATATANETFMERADASLESFRTDGTWAAWVAHVDDAPPDGWPERSELWAARIDGEMDPARWAPWRATTIRYPNPSGLSRPILHRGLYVYFANDKRVDLVDLERRRRLELWTDRDDPRGMWWRTLLHLGGEYLFLVYNGPSSGAAGIQRYRLAELEGWLPLE